MLFAGANLGFSRGGGADFQKISESFDNRFFFQVDRIDFRSSPEH